MFVCFCNNFFSKRHLPPRWRNGGVFSQHRRCSCPAKGEVILMSAIAIEWVFEKYHSNQSMAWRFIFVLSELFIYKGSIFVVWGLNFCSLKAQCCCVKIWNCWRRNDWLTRLSRCPNLTTRHREEKCPLQPLQPHHQWHRVDQPWTGSFALKVSDLNRFPLF